VTSKSEGEKSSSISQARSVEMTFSFGVEIKSCQTHTIETNLAVTCLLITCLYIVETCLDIISISLNRAISLFIYSEVV
jgi:hypothetical protein